MDRVMTTAVAAQLIAEIRALIPHATFCGRFGATADCSTAQYVYDGTEMVCIPNEHRTVEVIVRDARHGNTVIVTVADDETAQAVARRIKAEVGERAKGTRRRIAVEHSVNRS